MFTGEVSDLAADRPAPLSARVCDGMVIALAAWTLLCNGVVTLGGNLFHLLLGAGALVVLALVHAVRRRPGPIGSAPANAPPPAPRNAALAGRRVELAALLVALSLSAGLLHARSTVLLWWLVLPYLAFALIRAFREEPAPAPPARATRALETTLWILAVGGALLPLLAQRQTADSAYYVNVALSISDQPGSTLFAGDTLFGIPGLPVLFPIYKLAAYEVLAGALAWVTGLPAIQVSHCVLPGVFGLFVALAYARLLRLLAPRTWLWILIPLLGVLVFVGEQNRFYGNFAFVRLHEGKAVFLSVLLPLLVAYGLSFARRPSLRGWLLLGAAQVASLGLSTSGLWLAPVVSGLALLSGSSLWRASLRNIALGLLASSYNVVVALAMRSQMAAAVEGMIEFAPPEQAPEVLGQPTGSELISQAWAEVLGTGALSAFCLFATLAASFLCPRGIGRRVCAVFPLGCALTLLNPYLAPVIAEHLTGAPVYFRVLWALPIPLFLALLLARPLDVASGAPPGRLRFAAYAIGLVSFLVFVPALHGLSARNDVHWDPFGLKVPHDPYRAAATLVESVPPRSQVLAPSRVTLWVSTFHEHPYSLVPRRVYLRIQSPHMDPEEVTARTRLYRIVSGMSLQEELQERLGAGIERFEIQGVCFDRSGEWTRDILVVLKERGFSLVEVHGDYEVWTRRSPPQVR